MQNIHAGIVDMNIDVKVIKTSEEHRSALEEAEQLVALDPRVGTPEADRLELLTLLIEDYEARNFPVDVVDPVEAIEFRMNEQGLRQKDLVSMIGSRSRVSEVLARKRPLTVHMIRALSVGLGIPADVLVGEIQENTSHEAKSVSDLDLNKFPAKEMDELGWFETLKQKFTNTEDLVRAFLAQLPYGVSPNALYRRTLRGENLEDKSFYSTLAWTARVLIRAKEFETMVPKFSPDQISLQMLRELAQLSATNEGPRFAVDFLAKHGIILIFEPRLPNTLIDGAAMLMENGTPVVALTLRYDRVDYFWFTLLHEVVHVWKHLSTPDESFVDRIENIESNHLFEKEANKIARDSMIPRANWKRSQAFMAPSKENILKLAKDLNIDPAIVAGRLQFETGHYDRYRELLGQGMIRKCFPGIVFR